MNDETIAQALLDAFDKASLEQMLRTKLDAELEEISTADNFKTVVYDVVHYFRRMGQVGHLVVSASMANPGNASLQSLMSQFSLGGPAIERRFKTGSSDMSGYDSDRIERIVERIERDVEALQSEVMALNKETATLSVNQKDIQRRIVVLDGPNGRALVSVRNNPMIPGWAIALIIIAALSLIPIISFALFIIASYGHKYQEKVSKAHE